MNTFAIRTNIKRVREDKGISQSEMAKLLHMDERNYKRIESGEKKTIDLDLLGRVADALETDWSELISGEVVNIENNDIHDNSNNGVAGIVANNHNAFPEELKEAYKDMMQLMRDLIAEKDKTITMQQQLLESK